MNKLTTIYLQLLNEGTLVYRPVMAEEIGDQLFKILSKNNDPEDEKWQFKTGDVVKCESRFLVDVSPKECLVAVENYDQRGI